MLNDSGSSPDPQAMGVDYAYDLFGGLDSSHRLC